MAIRVLVTDGMNAAAEEQLRKDGFEMVDQFYAPEELGAALREFDAVIIRSATKIKKQQIDDARGGKLKLIIRAGVGMDNIDIPYAEAAGITCTNTPNSSSNAVAELAISLLFSCARGISTAGNAMRNQKWDKNFHAKGMELTGKTVGVIGYGRIGRRVGDKCQALGMNVLSVVHRNKPAGCECETMKFVTMDELLAQSDAIILCAPGGDGKALVDAESIAKMKDGVVIVNVSRGANVNEADLLAALNSGKVRAAGLDVWMDEKNPNWELAAHPCVSCTPHIGASTVEAQKGIGAELVEIIKGFNF